MGPTPVRATGKSPKAKQILTDAGPKIAYNTYLRVCYSAPETPFRSSLSRPGRGLSITAQVIAQSKRNARVQVLVRDNNVDQALRVLKKKMQREGVFREMKLRSHYEKPSERKTREKAEAVRRARKLARKKMQREGLLPMKPRVIPGAAPGGRPGAPGARPAPRRSF
jgi:small subunit ribosomal protein S21